MSSVWMMLLAGVASAAQVQLRLESRELVEGQTVSARLMVVGGRASGVPRLPVDGGLSVDFQGQSSDFSWVNGTSTRVTSYVYSVSALDAGSWTLGPVELVVGDEKLKADPVTLRVGERDASLSTAGISAELSDDTPFLGQTVVYTLQYRHEERLLDARWTPPDYDGFVTERSAEAAERTYSLEADGKAIGVKEIRVPLVAVGEGKRTIGPSTLLGVFPDETRRKRRGGRRDLFEDFGLTRDVKEDRVTASAIPLQIRSLPDEGRPADFTGLVGRFVLRASTSTTQVAVGESLTVTLELVGDGTLVGFELPPAPEDAGFRAYDDAPEVVAQLQDGSFVTKATFRRAVVPEAEGSLLVPPVELVVFDPVAEAYVAVRSDAIALTVGPGEADAGEVSSFSGQAPTETREVDTRGDDILPVPSAVSLGDATLSGAAPLSAALVAVPGLAWMVVAAGGRTRREDPWKALRARLAGLPSDPGERLAALESLFRDAAGLRLSRPAPGLDEAAIEGLGDEALSLYRDLGAARYGGMSVSDLEPRVRAFVEGGAA